MTKSDTALTVRNFVTANCHGALSTISLSQNGYPFGSMVLYDLTSEGDLIIHISFIAEHYRNLARDPRASLIVIDPLGSDDPQSSARATVLVEFSSIPSEQVEGVRNSFENRFPNSIKYEIEHDFTFMKGVVAKVRWIGGFAAAAWVDGERYRGAFPDPLTYWAPQILEHMNYDHVPALRSYAKCYCNIISGDKPILMRDLTSTGFSLMIGRGKAKELHQVFFREPCATPEAARTELVRMAQEARS